MEEKNQEKKDEKLEENIQAMEKVMLHKKEIPQDEIKKINAKVFENILIADIVMIFLYFICLGSLNIESNVFMIDLKVFSIGLAVLSIFLFERSYRKESSNLCIHAIECLLLAVALLGCTYIYVTYFHKFHIIVATISFLFSIYYVGKAIVVYQRMKQKYYAKNSDIQEIIKK